MFELLILISCLFFLLHSTGRHRVYAGIIAWTSVVIVFISGLPSWMEESNILPVMAALSIPFLFITIALY